MSYRAPLAGEAINLKSSNAKRNILVRGSSEHKKYLDAYVHGKM